MSTEEQFERIADQASTSAEDVKCGVEKYQDGLRYIIETLAVDLAATKETQGTGG